MLKLKLHYFGYLMRRIDSLEKTLIAGKDGQQEKKGVTEDEMVGWHHRLNGHEFEQTPGDSEGQGSLACCSPWDRKEYSGLTSFSLLTGLISLLFKGLSRDSQGTLLQHHSLKASILQHSAFLLSSSHIHT